MDNEKKEYQKIADQVAIRREEIAEIIKTQEKSNGLSSAFIKSCMHLNEKGSGRLYAAVNGGNFLYDVVRREWFRWQGNYWERDMEARHFAAIEKVNDRLYDEVINLHQKIKESGGDKDEVKKYQKRQEKIYKRINYLSTVRGCTTCLKMASSEEGSYDMTVRSEIFDQDPWLLACLNGVINLKTGELISGRPDQFISKAVPHEYKGIEEPAPRWEKTLEEILESI